MRRLVRLRFIALCCLGALGLQAPAHAQDANALRYNVRVEPALTLAGAAAWITSEVLKEKLAPSACRWCDDNGLDRSVRSRLRWEDTKIAARTSDVLAFAGVPLLALSGVSTLAMIDGHGRQVLTDFGIIFEAVVLSADLNQIIKFAAGRERPFVHALSPEQKARTDHPADNNLSFYSGHTSPAFATAVSASMIATLRGRRFAPLMWGTLLPLAAVTGYLRIAADKHYFSDVLVGAAVGSAIGILIPLMHRTERAEPVSVSASASSLTLTWQR